MENWNIVAKHDIKRGLPRCKMINCYNYLYLGNRWKCDKCSLIFCSGHRLYEKHNCSVYEEEVNNFKKDGKLFRCAVSEIVNGG